MFLAAVDGRLDLTNTRNTLMLKKESTPTTLTVNKF
jgi:hypothetical protein